MRLQVFRRVGAGHARDHCENTFIAGMPQHVRSGKHIQ
jgi:hypothetical protein